MYLLSLVSLPLVIQSLATTFLVLRYELLPKNFVTESNVVQLISTIFISVLNVVIFTGIVLVGLQPDSAPGYNGVATTDIGAAEGYNGKYVPHPVMTGYTPAPNPWTPPPYSYYGHHP